MPRRSATVTSSRACRPLRRVSGIAQTPSESDHHNERVRPHLSPPMRPRVAGYRLAQRCASQMDRLTAEPRASGSRSIRRARFRHVHTPHGRWSRVGGVHRVRDPVEERPSHTIRLADPPRAGSRAQEEVGRLLSRSFSRSAPGGRHRRQTLTAAGGHEHRWMVRSARTLPVVPNRRPRPVSTGPAVGQPTPAIPRLAIHAAPLAIPNRSTFHILSLPVGDWNPCSVRPTPSLAARRRRACQKWQAVAEQATTTGHERF